MLTQAATSCPLLPHLVNLHDLPAHAKEHASALAQEKKEKSASLSIAREAADTGGRAQDYYAAKFEERARFGGPGGYEYMCRFFAGELFARLSPLTYADVC
jgi:hypothetical protein